MLVHDREDLVEDRQSFLGLYLRDGARRHHMHAVEVGERHESALLALRNEFAHGRRGAAVRSQRLAGRAIRDEVEGPEDAETTHVADDGVALGKGAKTGAEHVLADGLRVLDDAFLFHSVDRRNDGRRRQRMA